MQLTDSFKLLVQKRYFAVDIRK